MKLLRILFIASTAALLFRCNHTEDTKVTDICISINDFDVSNKSICLDSSGFYYLSLDSNTTAGELNNVYRVNLSGYIKELQLFKSFDTSYFSKIDNYYDTTCAMTKEPFTVYIKQNGKEFISHPPSIADCDTSSYLYKMELVRNFFMLLKNKYPPR